MAAVAASLDMLQPGVFNSEEMKRAFGKEALIEYCKQNNLSPTGTKPDLVHRILEYLETKAKKNPASPKSSQSPKSKGSGSKGKGRGKEVQKDPEPSPKPNTRSSPSRDQSPARGKSKAKGKGSAKSQEQEKAKDKKKEEEAEEEASGAPGDGEEIVTAANKSKKGAKPKPVKATGKASPPKPATPKPSSAKPSTPKSHSKPARSPSPSPSPVRTKASPAKPQTPKQKPATPKGKTPPKPRDRDSSPGRAKSPARNKAAGHDPRDMDMVAAQQFFKFHPLSFFDDVINAVQDNFVDGADDLEKHLKKDHPKDGKAIGEGLTEFLKDMQKSVNANFDRFEVYGLRNVFQVPRGLDAAVQLPPLDEAPVDPLIELVMARRTLQESMQEAARADQELLARQEETAALERLVESLKAARRPSPQLAREVGEAAERLHTEVRRLQGHDSLVGGLQPRLDQDIELLGKDLTGAQ